MLVRKVAELSDLNRIVSTSQNGHYSEIARNRIVSSLSLPRPL
jgi:hypothetical protein